MAGTGLLILLSASCGSEGEGAVRVSECPVASSDGSVAQATGDPVEAITAEFAKAGAQLEDGAIVESSIDDRNFAGVYWVDDEVDAFRDQLSAVLRAHGVPDDVVIDSTVAGRMIEVRVLDDHALPVDFGSSVPAGTFSVREVDDLFREV